MRELGVGGMGSVWLAHHIGLDTPCAVKFINSEVASQADVRARFEREAKAAAQLRSSHVVQILDYGVWEGFPYIAMEYLEGEDLGARLKRVGKLSPLATVLIIVQVARALTKAHAAGLIHRDLKPENIFLVSEDEQEVAKVLDFGIAKSHAPVLENNTTKAGALLGTPHYMSPEQAQGTKAIDYRSDLWSLAVLAFQCLTGTLPFNSEALGDLLVQIIVNRDDRPVPSKIAPELPPALDLWWARAVAYEPENRFQSAKELADTLAVALGIASASAPGMTPFATPGSGVHSLSTVLAMASKASMTPPQPIQRPAIDFDVDTLLANIAPTTGPAVSMDGPAPADSGAKRRGVPLAVGIGVGALALIAGVGIALWGNSYLRAPNPAGPSSGADSASAASSSSPNASSGVDGAAAAAPSGAPAPPSSGAAPQGSSAVASSSAAPSSSVPGLKLPVRPKKPKEKDFGF